MIQSYLKIAWRNLLRHKTFSFINVFGLALSMSVCLVVICIIKDAYSYDLFHPEGSERTYRILTEVERKDGGTESYASSPYMVAKKLTEDYAQVELWTPMLLSFNGDARVGGKQLLSIQGMFSDASFFKMFGYEMAVGDPATALNEPFSMVLTDEMAERFFQNENAVGKEIEMPGYGSTFKVTGVLKKAPGKSHLEFDAIGSLATQLALEKLPDAWVVTSDWLNIYGGYQYVRLRPGADVKSAELALAQIAKTHYADLELESRDGNYRFELQPLGSITPGRMLSQTSSFAIPAAGLWFLSGLALIIMLAAAFNYMNLTIARSLLRTKEVGVRKVMGATRGQVFWQLTSEAVVTSLLALGLSYLLFKLGKVLLNQGATAEVLNFMGNEDLATAGWFLLFALVVGLFAGALPATVLSKTSPLQVLQKLQNVKFIQKFGLRKALLCFQFTITLVFLFSLTIMHRQANFAIHQNFGFDKPQTLLVEMQGTPYDKLSTAFSKVKGVETISAISHPMGTFSDMSEDVRSDSVPEKTAIRFYYVDPNYMGHFGLTLLAGENFPENQSQERELFALVNESFCERFKLGAPAEAVGKPLTIGDSLQLVVKGVLENFPFKPAFYSPGEPMFLRSSPNHLNIMNLELAGTDHSATLLELERTWKQIQPERDFDAEFFDQRIRSNYAEMVSFAWVIGFLGLLGMVIACLGLLGMTMYTVETKAKEISLRKILGASVGDLAILLSKSYFIVLGIAVLIATVLTWLVGSELLKEFEQRISMSPWLFLPGILVLALIAGLTVGSQTVKAALGKPVKSLRSE